jgi:hypothetical protein
MCPILNKAKASALKLLPDTHTFIKIELKVSGKQRVSYVHSLCDGCKFSCCTRVNNLNGGFRPACDCFGEARWERDEKFYQLKELIDNRCEVLQCELVADLEWWQLHKPNRDTQIPLRCLNQNCKTERLVRLSSIQQGGGVGCPCRNKSAGALHSHLKELLGIRVPDEVPVASHPYTQYTLKVDFGVILQNVHQDDIRDQIQQVAHRLTIACPSNFVWSRQTKEVFLQPLTAFEHDGDFHFTLCFNGKYNSNYALSDMTKELQMCLLGVTIIRVTQRSIWWDNNSWREFVREALQLAISDPGRGRIIHQRLPCYSTWGAYAWARDAAPFTDITEYGSLCTVRSMDSQRCKQALDLIKNVNFENLVERVIALKSHEEAVLKSAGADIET